MKENYRLLPILGLKSSYGSGGFGIYQECNPVNTKGRQYHNISYG